MSRKKKAKKLVAIPTKEVRQKILSEFERLGDERAVSIHNGIPLAVVKQCIGHQWEQEESETKAVNPNEAVQTLSLSVLTGLLLSTQQIVEQLTRGKMKPTEASRELRQLGESIGLLRGGIPRGGTYFNFSGDTEINLSQFTDEQLAEHAEHLAQSIRRVAATTVAITGTEEGEETPGRELDLELLPGQGAVAPGALSETHGTFLGGKNPSGAAVS